MLWVMASSMKACAVLPARLAAEVILALSLCSRRIVVVGMRFLKSRNPALEDLDRPQAAIDAIRATAQHLLVITPFSFRKAAQNPAQRELIIPFGGTGWVTRYEIVSMSEVVALTVRHEREEDYH